MTAIETAVRKIELKKQHIKLIEEEIKRLEYIIDNELKASFNETRYPKFQR